MKSFLKVNPEKMLWAKNVIQNFVVNSLSIKVPEICCSKQSNYAES